MNPWAFIAIALGILIIIIGVKGSQHRVTSAITGHPTGPNSAGSSGGRTGGIGLGPAGGPVIM